MIFDFFPKIISSIYLPTLNSSIKSRVIKVLEQKWDLLISGIVGNDFDEIRFDIVAEDQGVDKDELLAAARQKLETESIDSSEHIMTEEEYSYHHLIHAHHFLNHHSQY